MRHDPSRFSIPGDFWSRPPVVHALTRRDGGALFALVQKYAGASQSGISMRVGCMSQPDVSRIMSGKRMVTDLAIFESVADGLDMPDAARVALGLAPRPDRRPASTQPRPAPATGPAAPAAGPGVDRKDDDPVRRRSFLGLAAGAA
ncbi:MAG TPA: hypothetical protein VKP11_06500, partial [Frankiaceae bacterium]|nr:hypothetical protein [Frankiaceae bacterium]